MGKAIILTNCDFSAHNIGQVTFTQDIPLISLDISGPDSASGSTNVTTYTPVYNPVNTNQRGVTWTITSGSEYATITTGGTLSILEGASGSAVTIKVTSTIDSSIYATKNITVTYDAAIETNTITVTATATSLSASATTAVTSNITITFSGGLSTTLTINSGSSNATKSISAGSSSRTCNLSVSPLSDSNFNYVLSSSTVTIPAGIETNTITVTATENTITATSSAAVTSAVTVTFTGDLSTTLTIASGSTTASGSIATSSSERTCNLAVSPTGDTSYNYVLSSSTVTIPAEQVVASLLIVGPDTIDGDVRAGNYYVIDTTNMKQVVGTSGEVTDNYKEYLGAINWSITSGSGNVEFITGSGTEGNLNVKTGANNSSATISAAVGSTSATKNISATYTLSDYVITSFSDLEEIDRVINNGTESTITLTKASGSAYTPTNGDGLSGAHIRMDNDIDCGGSHVGIGKWYGDTSSNNKFFKGYFDGAGYTIKNLGGTVSGYNNAADCICPLFRAINGCTIRNIKLDGNLSWVSSYRRGVLTGWGMGNNTIERIYSKVTNSFDSGSGVDFIALLGPTRDSYITGFNGKDIVDLNTYTVTSGSNTSIRCLTAGNFGDYTKCAVYPTSTSGKEHLSFGYVQNKNISFSSCLAIPTEITPLASSEVGLIKFGGSTAATASFTNIYYVNPNYPLIYVTSGSSMSQTATNSYNLTSGSSPSGWTTKTEEELKSGELTIGSDYIQHSGYYPIINNQYAIESDILAKAAA